jgi:hypothetical protein
MPMPRRLLVGEEKNREIVSFPTTTLDRFKERTSTGAPEPNKQASKQASVRQLLISDCQQGVLLKNMHEGKGKSSSRCELR